MKTARLTGFFRTLAALLALLTAGCLTQGSSPSSAPANLTVTPGESRAVLDWDTEPGLTYWVYYKEGDSVSTSDYDHLAFNVTPPYVISGLTNDTQYSFIVAASDSGSSIGPATAIASATPRLIGPTEIWTVGDSLTTENLLGVAFGNGKFVAVGTAATVFSATQSYTDTGGISGDGWVQATSLPVAASVDLGAVIYSGTRFVALGDDGSTMTSTDAATWETGTAISGGAGLHGIAYATINSDPVFIAVGDGGAIYKNTSSTLSVAWTTQTSGTVQNLYGVTRLNGRFVAVGANGTLLTSTDGDTWSAQTSNTASDLHQAAYGAGLYVAVGDAGAVVSSSDATTWTAQTPPTTESLRSIAFGPDAQFLAVGTSGAAIYSTTGTDGDWSESNAGVIDLNSIVVSSVAIAVGDAGANVSGK